VPELRTARTHCQRIVTAAEPGAAAEVTNCLGRTLFVDPQDRRGRRLIDSAGDANPHSMTMWRDLLLTRPWDLVVDVGANYGEMLLGAHLPKNAEVVAFEPNENVLPHLRRSVTAAGLPVEVRTSAVSDHRGHGVLLQDRDWSGMSHLSTEPSADASHSLAEQVCSTTTLDHEFFGSAHRTACIKIDIEGHEEPAIAGALAWLDSLDEHALMIEIMHLTPLQISSMSIRWCMYLRHLRTGRLVRIASCDEATVHELVTGGVFYGQDAIFSATPLAIAGAAEVEERESLLAVIRALDEQIDQAREALSESVAQLEQIQASRSWRFPSALRKLGRGSH